MRFEYGLKLWSTNLNYIEDAVRLYNDGLYSYIELYTVPGSYKGHLSFWKKLPIPYVIHAPHYLGGVNLADISQKDINEKLLNEARLYADALNASIIIVHPGINGDIGNAIHQLNIINDPRIVIENMPYYALDDLGICNGKSPDDIRKIVHQVQCGFCLDIGHAIYSANTNNISPFEMIEEFISIKPIIYHLSDGVFTGKLDEHENLGKGTFPLKNIIAILQKNDMITIETKKSYNKSLKDFEEDVLYLNNMVIDK